MVWDIQGNDIFYGDAVGYEAQFSQDQYFGPILAEISTSNSGYSLSERKIEYSLDGETWTEYPYGVGVVFNAPYQIRILLNETDFDQLTTYGSGVIRTFRNDLSGDINSYSFSGSSNSLEPYGGGMFFNDASSVYRVDIDKDGVIHTESFSAFSSTPLGLAVDDSRGTFWQVNGDSVYLRNFYGDLLQSTPIPPIHVVPQSSSSSSSSSTSSSSSSSLSSLSSSPYPCTSLSCSGNSYSNICSHFTDWTFSGVGYNNTDNGKLYVSAISFTFYPADGQMLKFYKGPEKEGWQYVGLVTVSQSTGSTTLDIVPKNNSHLSGTVIWDNNTITENGELQCS